MPPEFPKQDELEAVLAGKTTAGAHEAMLVELRRRGRGGLDRVFENADVVVAFAESSLCMYSSAAGYPIACVPVGLVRYSEDKGRPFGLCLVAKAGQEELLLRFMSAFEQAFPSRPLPRPLLEW